MRSLLCALLCLIPSIGYANPLPSRNLLPKGSYILKICTKDEARNCQQQMQSCINWCYNTYTGGAKEACIHGNDGCNGRYQGCMMACQWADSTRKSGTFVPSSLIFLGWRRIRRSPPMLGSFPQKKRGPHMPLRRKSYVDGAFPMPIISYNSIR